MKFNRFILPAFAAGLLALGMGCGPSDSPVSLDKYAMPQEQANQPAENTQPGQVLDNSQIPETASATPTAETSSTMQEPTETAPEAAPSSTQANSTTENMTQPSTPAPLAFPGVLPKDQTENKQVRIKTNKGDIVFELLPNEGPKAASNFVYLANQQFYDGLKFHRVVPGFVIQGGDPLSRNDDPRVGTGGPGYKFEDDAVNLPYKQGIVAMANSGPNTNGSQFFIMLDDNNLPPSYSIFGRVTSGMDIVKQIQIGDIMTSVTVEAKK